MPPLTFKRNLVTPSNLDMSCRSLRSGKGPVTVDCETSTKNQLDPDGIIAGIVVYDPETEVSYYFTFNHVLSQNLPVSAYGKIHDAIKHRDQIFHNAIFDLHFLRRVVPEWPNPTQDTMIMVRCIEFTRKAALKTLAAALGHITQDLDELVNFKKGETVCGLTAQAILEYATNDGYFTWIVFLDEAEKLLGSTSEQIYRLEMKTLPATYTMEANGFPINVDELDRLENEYGNLIIDRAQICYDSIKEQLGCDRRGTLGNGAACPYACGENPDCEFPLHSPQKMSHLLFDVMRLPTSLSKRTKKGWSVSADVINKLRDSTELSWLDDLLGYKEAVTGRGKVRTYRKAVQPDGKIHAELIQNHVISGRYASAKPNLQQVPYGRRGQTTLVKGFRRAFVASPDHYLLKMDFSQIEPKIFAVRAGAQGLIDSVIAGKDFHTHTGALTFDVPDSQVTKDQRTSAKAVGLGALYGQTEHGLANKLGIPVSSALRIQDRFFAGIPEFKRYTARIKQECRKLGGIFTQFGRWIPIPDIHSRNRWNRERAERLSVNAGIQGTAADVMKLAIARVYAFLQAQDLDDRVKMILTVHDEIDFEVHNSIDPHEIASILAHEMEVEFGPITLNVDAEYGPNWYDLTPLNGAEEPEEEPVLADVTIDVEACKEYLCTSEVHSLLTGLREEDGLTVRFALSGEPSDLGSYALVPGRYNRALITLLQRLDPIGSVHTVH